MELTRENLYIATEYFKGNTAPFDAKDNDYKNLFLTFATDNNSSSVREAVTMNFLGYTQHAAKHGADGVNPVTGQEVEVKPKYIAEGKTLSSVVGNFNDMTMQLLEKKKDYSVVCSCFSSSRLIYVVEFPISVIYEKLKLPIVNAVAGRRVVSHFSYKDYDHDLLKVHYYDDETATSTKILSAPHRAMLTRHYAK